MSCPRQKRRRSCSCASSDLDSDEPMSKRTRIQEEVKPIPAPLPPATVISSSMSPEQSQPVRDDEYYMQDGSCILQVEDTLFNVHRTVLAKDNSLFSSMFELPQGEEDAEGDADDRPITLHGDTVQQFKHLLWTLYALPHELAEVTTPQIEPPQLDRLIDIARMAFKYHFKSLETWALDVITGHVSRTPSQVFAIPYAGGPLSPYAAIALVSPAAIASHGALLSRLTHLAQLCSHTRLQAALMGVLRQLMVYSVQYAHLAMTLADEFDLRTLRGIAYFEVMQRGDVVTRTQAQTQIVHSCSATDAAGRLIISREQKLRLLQGYYRLTMVWERLRATPLAFEHAAACSATWHQHGCTQCWLDFWKEKTKSDTALSLGLADVTGRLRAILHDFIRGGSATYMHCECRTAAKKAIQDKIKQIEDALPDYFGED